MVETNELSKFFSLITLTKNLDYNVSQINNFINNLFFYEELKKSMKIISVSIESLYKQIVDYKTKIQLLKEKLKSSEEEIAGLKKSQVISNNKCCICIEEPCDNVFVNCGHLCICSSCISNLKTKVCPICRIQSSTIKIYYS